MSDTDTITEADDPASMLVVETPECRILVDRKGRVDLVPRDVLQAAANAVDARCRGENIDLAAAIAIIAADAYTRGLQV